MGARPTTPARTRTSQDKRGLFGIHIHNLNCPRSGTCKKGPNPFEQFTAGDQPMASLVQCYDPGGFFDDAYSAISRSLEGWVATAIQQAASR